MSLYGLDVTQLFDKGAALFADRAWIVVVVIRGDSFGVADFKSNLVRRVNDVSYAAGHVFNCLCSRSITK